MPRNDEFESLIGDGQLSGSRGVLGLAPPRPATKRTTDGAAPAYSRQVVSAYDGRPIGAYDFVTGDALTAYDPGGGFVYADFPQFISPPGYVTVLRRIVIDGAPGIMAAAGSLSWRLVIGGITQPNWTWVHGGVLAGERLLDTFIVIPAINLAVQLIPYFDAVVLGVGIITVQFSGNLILDANEPPNEQVGSLPHAVRVSGEGFTS